MGKTERERMRPLQAAVFGCMATCCGDTESPQKRVQDCMQRCGAPMRRAEQTVTQELKSFQGDHYLVALRQLANEALAFKASTQLSEEAYDAFLKQLSDEAGFKSAADFEKDVRDRSSLQVQELLEVLAEDGNFVAIALRRVEERCPVSKRT